MLIGALGLALLMIVHEAGHFVSARAFGMRVIRFSIGFGPTLFRIVPKDGFYWFTAAGERIRLRLWKHDPDKNGPTIYQVGVVPFLAYVQIAGMNPLEEITSEDKGSYANASLVARIVTIFSGPLANYLFASVLFFISLYLGGKPPDDIPNMASQVKVIAGGPAERASVRDGDRIVEIGGVPIENWIRMKEEISKHPSEPITIVVERGGQRLSLNITPDKNEEGKGQIWVSPPLVPVSGPKEAAVLALKKPPLVVKGFVVQLGLLVAGKVQGKLGGPIGIVKEVGQEAKRGWAGVVDLLGLLSASLCAINLMPFPALDGGRLLFLGYEATTRRRPNARVEAHIHAIGLVMMLGLMVYVTVFNDLGFGSK